MKNLILSLAVSAPLLLGSSASISSSLPNSTDRLESTSDLQPISTTALAAKATQLAWHRHGWHRGWHRHGYWHRHGWHRWHWHRW